MGGHFLVGPFFEGPKFGYPQKQLKLFLVNSLVSIKKGKINKCESLSLSNLIVRDAQNSVCQFDPFPSLIGLIWKKDYINKWFKEHHDDKVVVNVKNEYTWEIHKTSSAITCKQFAKQFLPLRKVVKHIVLYHERRVAVMKTFFLEKFEKHHEDEVVKNLKNNFWLWVIQRTFCRWSCGECQNIQKEI